MEKARGPTLVVAAAIVKGNNVLLARRFQPELPEAHLKWELPGGKIELEESPHEAIFREIKEELNTEIQVVRLLPHVQSNIYHMGKKIIHTIIIAFESVIVRGNKLPTAFEDSINAVRWVEKENIDKLDLLKGTKEFVDCLEKVDKASYGSEHIFVRLERRNRSGIITDYWEIRSIYDLWKNFNLIERHGNLVTRSTHHKITENIKKDSIISVLTKRIRSLVSNGYYLVESDDIRFCPVIDPV